MIRRILSTCALAIGEIAVGSLLFFVAVLCIAGPIPCPVWWGVVSLVIGIPVGAIFLRLFMATGDFFLSSSLTPHVFFATCVQMTKNLVEFLDGSLRLIYLVISSSLILSWEIWRERGGLGLARSGWHSRSHHVAEPPMAAICRLLRFVYT